MQADLILSGCTCQKVCFLTLQLVLTLALLNKDVTPTYNFQPIRLLDLCCWYKFTYLMTNSADPDQLASSEANWSGSTLFAKTGHWGSARPGLMHIAPFRIVLFHHKHILWVLLLMNTTMYVLWRKKKTISLGNYLIKRYDLSSILRSEFLGLILIGQNIL